MLPSIAWKNSMAKDDIRFSNKPATIEHDSARGKVFRNSNNFTRGSQLFSHEVWMTWAGIKVPLFTWLGISALLLVTISFIQFREHESPAGADEDARGGLELGRSQPRQGRQSDAARRFGAAGNDGMGSRSSGGRSGMGYRNADMVGFAHWSCLYLRAADDLVHRLFSQSRIGHSEGTP